MSDDVKEIIEKYIGIINRGDIKTLLYITYRDRYQNPYIYELREILAQSDVCSMSESLKYAGQLFEDAFIHVLEANKNKYRKYASLRAFLYGQFRGKPAQLNNQFGMVVREITTLLHQDKDKLKISITTNPTTLDSEFYYHG